MSHKSSVLVQWFSQSLDTGAFTYCTETLSNRARSILPLTILVIDIASGTDRFVRNTVWYIAQIIPGS
jgi:hypothetical protein